MSKQNNTVTTTTASVTPSVAELQKLTPAQAAANFVLQTTAAVRAFIVAAKLLIVLEPTLKPGQTLGGIILKLTNVPKELQRRVKSTIDNGRYAMRVWKELVMDGHIAEPVFDTFTFGDIVSINRVMSGASRQNLTGPDVALVIESSPENWHEELDCLFTYGQSLADRAEVESKQAAKKTTGSDSPESPSELTEPDDTQSEDNTSPDAPDAPKPAEKDAPKSNIIPMTTKNTPTAETAFEVIAALEALLAAMPPAEVAKVAPAIAELNATVQGSLTAKSAKKAKAKKAA